VEALRQRFGKYHVLEKIAQGGMAEVYKVKTVGIAGFEKVQALKRILPSSAREGRFIRSFIDEARIAVELTHRNIVQVFDFGKADGELFLAMELIEGKDLRSAQSQAVARDTLPPIPVCAYIVSEVAQGLDYAHRKTDGYGGSLGIVHCDVSPSNVMLSSDGYVKILDFGIARATFASALERRRLRGKPRYMAPEQTLGEPPTTAADVFALGIIAWELFTGLPLYRGPDLKSILEAVRRTDPPRIDRIKPAVPREIVDAIATALSREPPARGTAADLAAACARTAMASGARDLATWLADLEQADRRPAAVPWQSDATSVSVPSANTPVPPSRPSRTASLANIPAQLGDFGEGTPGFAGMPPGLDADDGHEAPTTPAPSDRLESIEPPDVTQTTPVALPLPLPHEAPSGVRPDPAASALFSTTPLRREPTVSVTNMHKLVDISPWPQEGATLSGIARLVDGAQPEPHKAATEPFERPSFESLPFVGRPSMVELDEAPTHHVAQPVDLADADDLDEPVEPPMAPFEEPIDDDLPALSAGIAVERRRTVVVAGALSGGSPDLLRPVTQTLGELAYQRGGVVTHLDDDALVVVFGLEIAGEDDVAIAMGWALDAGAMARDAVADGSIVLRIGARAGVGVTVQRPHDTHTTQDSMDGASIPQDAIDEARALARDATPDRPLFVGGAGRITSGLYALRDVADRVGHGGWRRGRVIELVGPRGFMERDHAQPGARNGKFVGRAVQLAELDVLFGLAVTAQRRLVVLIHGAAGTGKSRLVDELIARRTATSATPIRVVTTTTSPASRLAPFSLIIDLYQASLGLPPARGRAARRQVTDRLLHLLGRAGVTPERARAVATDLDHAMELRDGVTINAPEVADLRPRIAAGLATFRMAMADRERPLLSIVEDLHHADSASLEVLRHTLAVPASGPELLVLTARPEGFVPPAVDTMLTIGDLVGADLRALIADRLGDQATPFNIAAVLARGGGNPLFVEELAQAVREAGPDGDDIPASARDVVLARMERLTPGARTALRFAAVLGPSSRIRLLDELLAQDDVLAQRTSSDFASREHELEELITSGFLVRAETSSSDGEVQFARGLIRDVVYESLSAHARQESHARIGRLLASRFFAGREEPPATVAEHLERGGEPAGAAAFWLRAGRLALTASDADAAVACFSRTLLLDRGLAPSPPTATSRARRREALSGREEAHRLQGNLGTDSTDLDELQRLCEGDPVRLADVAIRRAQRMLRLGDYANATIATVVAEDHAVAARDDRLHGEALRVRAEILERLGRFDEALQLIDVARELFHRQRAIHDEMAAMIGRGRIHLLRAHYEAARDAYRPVMSLIDRTGDPWLERIVTNHVAVIEMCLGNFTTAMESAQRSLELCRRYGDRGREGDALSVIGIILLEVGLYDRAAESFAEALDILAHTASRWSRADCMIYAGVCELRRRRPSALLMIDEALGEARRIGARYLEANALIARAGALLAFNDLENAIEDAAAGTAVAHAATLVGYEIQGLARHALALSRVGGRDDEASDLVRQALELLESQVYIEGSEEEVLAACVEVLATAGDPERAAAVRERARASARRKLDALVDPEWRAAYAAIPEIVALLRTSRRSS